MEFEKVNNIPSANMTQEDMEALEYLDSMEEGKMAKVEEQPAKVKSLTRRLKPKVFRVYKREDATYVKRMPVKETEE